MKCSFSHPLTVLGFVPGSDVHCVRPHSPSAQKESPPPGPPKPINLDKELEAQVAAGSRRQLLPLLAGKVVRG